MAPRRTLRVDQGATFSLVLYWREPLIDLVSRDLIRDDEDNIIPGPPLDLSGYIARMQARRTLKDSVKMLDLSSPSNGIVVSQPNVRVLPWVRVATTANITLTGIQTVDGVALAVGDRVLVKDQTSTVDDGIYVVASGAWALAADANSAAELTQYATVWVYLGTANSDTVWRQENVLSALTDPQSWLARSDVGKVEVTVTDEQTALVATSGVYDIELESAGGEVSRLLEGKLRVSAEVTR